MRHFFFKLWFFQAYPQLNLTPPKSKIKCCFEYFCTSLGHSHIPLNSLSSVTAEVYAQY